MSKDKVKKPIVLQVLPELNQGGVELGTIQIAEALTNSGLKNFVTSCHRAVNDAKKDCEKKMNEFEKLRIKEERWLLRNGKVDFEKVSWIVAD